MRGRDPLVSIILCVRNGLPHVEEAIASVRGLTYRNFELVVQDGASTDGTTEYLRSLSGIPGLSLVSEPDTGIGQGFNRAVRRCRGDIVGSIDADNLLAADALEIVVRRFAEFPDAAVIYGACHMIDGGAAHIHTWQPPPFDLLGLMDGAVVPPFATSFFSRAICGPELRFDEAFRTVADFELWLRVAHLPLVRVDDVLATVRVGSRSSTWNAGNYDDQCDFKRLALRRFLEGPHRERALQALHRRAEAGIYLWAVDSMAVIGGGQEQIDRYFARTADADLRSDRFRDVLKRARPRLPPSNPTIGQRLFDTGVEYLAKGLFGSALVYFEYLQDAGFPAAGLPELVAQSRKEIREALLGTDVVLELQAEVSRRDRMIAEQQAWWAGEVIARDQELDNLRREIEWMRRGWRKFVIGRLRPPAPRAKESDA